MNPRKIREEALTSALVRFAAIMGFRVGTQEALDAIDLVRTETVAHCVERGLPPPDVKKLDALFRYMAERTLMASARGPRN